MSDMSQGQGEGLDPIAKLDRETKRLIAGFDPREASHLVSMYYRFQEHRIALGNQVRTMGEAGKPTDVLQHFFAQQTALERQTVAALKTWAESRAEGAWALDQKGVGPVLAAGLSAMIDIRKAPTVGHIWSFAGLNPQSQWLGREKSAALIGELWPTGEQRLTDWKLLNDIADRVNRKVGLIARMAMADKLTEEEIISAGGDGPDGLMPGTVDVSVLSRPNLIAALAKRPYNADLKVLCWKIGDSFCKVSGRDDAYYGHIYKERKVEEVRRNETGQFSQQASLSLTTKKISDKKLRETYEAGQLPPGRLELRARRYAVKLFLSHWHDKAYRAEFNAEPPLPYPIAHGEHVHYIAPPPGGENFNQEEESA